MQGVAATGAAGKLPVSLPLSRAIGHSIANSPDRGALLSYANKGAPTKQEGAYTWYPVAISEAHAFKGIADGEMTVPSPDGGQVKLRYERHVEEIDGNWTWIGRVVGGDPLQEAIITFGEKAVFGSIPMGEGKLPLSLQTRQGQLFAVKTDPSKVVSATAGHVDVLVPEAAALRATLGAAVSQSAQTTQGAVAVAQGAPATGANTVDIAIGYTPEFAADNGGASGAATRLVYLVQVGNQAFLNSKINGYLRIVNTVQVSYTNATENAVALNELTGSNGSSPVTVPASLAPLRTARDQYGADIAVLVRKFTTPENNGCGIAWLMGAGMTSINQADAPFGFAVISDGYDQGEDGKTYYCADETLVHEAGHLMGAAHDRANSKIDNNLPAGGTNLLYGAYSYSFGLNTDASNGNFFTLDAYGDLAGGDTSYRVFSNPAVTICGGRACGVANSEDNARTLNQTLPVVATFRATVVPFGGTKDDFDGDGQSDILWRNATSGVNIIWKGASSTAPQYMYSVQSPWFVAGVGDFDGDGRSDILWRNGSSGGNAIWKGGNATTQQTISSVPIYWSVAGIGDFNGDGIDDILWRNQGLNVIWRGGNASSQQAVTALDKAWKAAGIGDFNGDGVSDILWRNETTGANVIWRSASSTNTQSVSTLPLYWKVAGVGDFNGDGRDDILWRNGSANAIWRSGSHTTPQTVASVPTYWLPAAIADYDGDGTEDILWRNGTINTIWRSANSATQMSVASQSTSWAVQPVK
jgi:hypothetical protein